MKRITLLALSATTAMAQAPAAAPVATPAATTPAAPLAPVSTRLLQAHPGAPASIDDVLLVPSANAGQKALAFEWADDPSNTQAYIIWDKYFAAAQFTGAQAANNAQTIASFGLATSTYGAGISIATRDTTTENAASLKTTTTRALTQFKVFGSATKPDNFDLYGSIQRLLKEDYVIIDDGDNTARPPVRHEQYLLQVGARKYPNPGVQGLAWNLYTTDGFDYNRAVVGSKNNTTLIANLDGQVGYVLVSDDISFLPGVDAYLHYANGPRNPDYSLVGGVSPYAAILLPLFEHWTLKGGARYAFEQSLIDNNQGDPSVFTDHQLITGTSGNFGLRYDHKRWALEAQIGNGLITQGPAVISGNDGYNLFASLALTVNLK